MYKGRQTPTIESSREPFGKRPASRTTKSNTNTSTPYGTGPRRPPLAPAAAAAAAAASPAIATKRVASRLGGQPAKTEAVPERRRGLRRYKSADLDVADTQNSQNSQATPKKPQAQAQAPRRIGFAGKQQSESAIRLDSRPASNHHQSLGPQRSRIPKPIVETELASEAMEQYKKSHELEAALATERQLNDQLLAHAKDLEVLFEEARHRQRMAELDLETLQERAGAMEEELERERASRAAAEEKARSLSAVIEAQTHGNAQDAGGWREELAQMARQIGNVHAQCTLMRPESEMDAEALRDMRTIEAYMERGQPRRDGRVARRRSTALFAGLVRPSGGGEAEVCDRCQQLQEAVEALELDNRYYQQANARLRQDLEGIVSRHNALVHLFEKERARRREARANTAAERQQQQLASQFQLNVK